MRARCAVAVAALMFACGGRSEGPPDGAGDVAPDGSIGDAPDAAVADASVPDASTQEPPDASVAPDAGAPDDDAGPPDASVSAGGFPDAGPDLCPLPQPLPDCVATPPQLSSACRTITPKLPVALLDGGLPGPCEQIISPGNESERHIVMRYDAQGHLVSRTATLADGTILSGEDDQFDGCGRLVYSDTNDQGTHTHAEYDYRADGLLGRKVVDRPGFCTQQTFAYPPGDAGVIDKALDGVTCDPAYDYQYGPDGRVSQAHFAGNQLDWPTTDQYTYGAEGGVSSYTDNSGGYVEGYTWDEFGALTLSFMNFPNNEGGDREAAVYGEGHRLVQTDSSSSSRGPCGFSRTGETFAYDDAGVLRTGDYVETVDSCPYREQHYPVVYTYPSPGVQVSQTFDVDGGVRQSQRITRDALGNILEIDDAAGDSAFQVTELRSYDGCYGR